MLGYLNLVKSWWPRIALVVILLLFAWYFIENIDDFKILLNVSPVYLLMVGLGYAITLIVNGLFVRTMLLAHQKEIGIFDSTLASIISAVGNFFFPVGTGALAQARFLKSKYDFNFKSFAVTLSGNYIIVFFVSSLLGILSLLALNEYGGFPSYNIVLAIFLGLFIATSFLAFLGAPEFLTRKVNEVNIKYLRRVARILSQIMDGWNFIVSRKKVLIWLVFYTVVNFLVMMMISYATIRAVGLSIGFSQLILYGALGTISIIVNITPASIGVREGIYIFTSAIFGFTAPQIIAISIVDRVVKFLILLIFLAINANRFKSKPEALSSS